MQERWNSFIYKSEWYNFKWCIRCLRGAFFSLVLNGSCSVVELHYLFIFFLVFEQFTKFNSNFFSYKIYIWLFLTDITNIVKKINIQIIVIGSTCTMLVRNLSFSLSHACIHREIYFKIKLYLFIVNNVIKYFRYSYYHFFFGSYVRYLKSIIFRVFQLSVVYFRLFANVQNKDSSDERVSEKNCVIAYC